MNKKLFFFIIALVVCLVGVYFFYFKSQLRPIHSQEKYFSSLKQLTFGGQNAEAYFSFDQTRLIFQSTQEGKECDQIYTMNLDGSDKKMVSTGFGKTTCSYFCENDQKIFYSSTHHLDKKCPSKPDYSKGYVWPLDPFDIFISNLDGSNVRQLTSTLGYDAESTLSPDQKTIVFTSVRNGDLDVYAMDLDGKNVKQLTHELGYDGGAFFSQDGEKIVYRAYHPKTEEEKKEYQKLLSENKIHPMNLQIFVMNKDGSDKKQVTNLPGSNFAPFFHPDGKRIIFSSNHLDPQGRNFDLFIINIDGTGLSQVTFDPSFDSFPMFSQDGKKLIFASNRGGKKRGETNIFLAEWDEGG